jgi:hypothetical protein
MEVKLYESVDLLGFCFYSEWEQVVSSRGFIGEKYSFSKIFLVSFFVSTGLPSVTCCSSRDLF